MRLICLVLILSGSVLPAAAATAAVAANPGIVRIAEPQWDVTGTFSEGLMWVKSGRFYGYVDTDGRMAVPFFDPAVLIYTGASITRMLDTVRVPYETAFSSIEVGDFHEGRAAIVVNGHGAFIDRSGAPMTFTDSENPVLGTVDMVASDGMLNRWVLPISSAFSDGWANVTEAKSFADTKTLRLMDLEGRIVSRKVDLSSFSDRIPDGTANQGRISLAGEIGNGLIPFRLTMNTTGISWYGYMGLDGKALPAVLESAGTFNGGLALAAQNGLYGFVDTGMRFIIQPQFDGCFVWDDAGRANIFFDGIASISRGGKWGLINVAGRGIRAYAWEGTRPMTDGMSITRKGGLYGYLSKNGDSDIAPRFAAANYFWNGMALVSENSGFYSLINRSGKAIGTRVWSFQGVKASPLLPQLFAYLQDGKWGLAKLSDDVTRDARLLGDPSAAWNAVLAEGAATGTGMMDGAGTGTGTGSGTGDGTDSDATGTDVTAGNPSEPLPTAAVVAIRTSSRVLVDGVERSFDAYVIDGSTYFKLRDIAFVLNGTGRQFEIKYDASIGVIRIYPGLDYTAVGVEMLSTIKTTSAAATPGRAKVTISGDEAQMTAWTISGSNYFKLRDLGKALDFGVSWNAEARTISISTVSGYEE